MGNLKKERNAIHKGFQHLRYHFPNGKTPKNILLLSSFFAHRNPVVKEDIGISLECYLNPNLPVIKELPLGDFPAYYKKEMNRKYLVRDILSPGKSVIFENRKDTFQGRNIYIPDTSKAKRDLNLDLTVSLQESLGRFLEKKK